ncbi:S9 family peptidase [Asticcacaulis taihuensis]|uniref:Dipeptidyl aminopeptidase/acylaminoacyl peptidase n=1 Tax=Asticcacaulis taihuensis TaxID=260084 RepID=A0A1G4Q945_9CAUL|nr:prolyl oligopeptidase family serine peptidase [Asticcacaulis taihuensis]SCW40955.1 Dipeptidyl aminopeptidase/acylaminoacyl peptidase [Asticcacaulis taihuensis]
MTRGSSNPLKALLKSTAIAALSVGLLAGGIGIAHAAYTPPAKPVSIDDLARYDELTGVTISPDGKHIAGLIAVKGQKWPVISIWDTDDLSKKPIWIPSETQRIEGVGFFSNDKIYFQTEQPITGYDGKPTFTTKVYYSDLEGRKIEEPFKMTGTLNKDVRDSMARTASARIFNRNLYDDTKVLMETVNPDDFAQKIFELDTKTGKTRTVALGSTEFNFVAAGVDLNTGEPLIKEQIDNVGGEYWYKVYIKDRATGEWVYHAPLSYKVAERKKIDIQGFDTDPNQLVVSTNINGDKLAIYDYDIAAQKFSAEPLFASDKYDIDGVGFAIDRANRKTEIFAVAVEGPATTISYLDPKWAAVQKSIEASFPGKNVNLTINRDTYQMAVVEVEAPDLPPQYYLYKDGKLQPLGGAKPWIDPKTLGKAEFVTYKARDGLDIPAFITYPPGWTADQGPVPLIVMPHGGPWARDHFGWDPAGWPQFFATRGIAVIQPQYRGSEGWGDKLWKAGDKEWGQKMSDDNDDAAAYLVSKGVADPKRMAIMGYSYGGFAAIAASVRPNSPYKCAIAGAGVSSLQRIGNLWGDSHIQRDIQGKTVDGMDPLKNVDKANIPILLYHGDHDRQADTEHSRMFYAAMKAAGKDVQYTEIKGMWHTLPWHVEWQEQSLGLMEDFLKSPKCGLIN